MTQFFSFFFIIASSSCHVYKHFHDNFYLFLSVSVLQIRMGNRDDLGIISHISP